jgi:hypothetical protein
VRIVRTLLSARTAVSKEFRSNVIRSLTLSAALIAIPAAAFADAPPAAPVPLASAAPITAQATPDGSPAPAVSPAPAASPTAEPSRRGQAAPMDALFPNADFGGPLIGTNIDPTGYPLESALAKSTDFGKWLDQNRIRVYGWANVGIELSPTSAINTYPISYNPVANRLELDQFVLRLERDPDTVQQDHADYGFRISNIYGVDYRWTSGYGYFSAQLQTRNQLNGYDNPETFASLYEPHFFQGGTEFFLGRVISVPDIEAQLAPQNYLYTHSLMFDWDSYTQTGLFAWSKLSNMFTIDYGIHFGDDVAPFTLVQHFPTGQLFVKYTTKANKDDILAGVDAYNNGNFSYYVAGANAVTAPQCAAYAATVQYANPKTGQVYTGIPSNSCLYGHDNLQQVNLVWYHTFNTNFHNAAEVYNIWTRNAPAGGSISNGPLQYAAGGGPGVFLPGYSEAVGAVDYLEYKFSSRDFVSFRTDYLNDPRGWRTGYASSYGSLTLGVTHHFSPLTWIRPEIRTEKAFTKGETPYDNLESASGYVGTKNYQNTLGIDLIQWF